MNETRDEYREILEHMGESKVRAEVEGGIVDTEKLWWSREWLNEKQEERSRRAEERADRAVAASERSAHASEKSARFAMLSTFIALATVAVTVLTGGFLAWLFSL